MMRNLRRMLSLLLVLGILLTGCVNGDSPVGSSTDPSGSSVSPSEPTDPKPTEPAPTDPEPTEPAPTDPKPTDPKPTEPAPTDPKPTEPVPTDPKPTEPAPTDPKPTEPAPTDPKPTEPTPTDPKPTEPTPTEPILVKISLAVMPKTEYKVGEVLDTSGGVILCQYSDGTIRRIDLTNNAVSGFHSSAAGTYALTVKYTEKGVTAQTTYAISVKSANLWDGSGTQSDPFLIRNLNDLMNLTKVLDKSGYYFRQVADIDCASVGNWIIIGDASHPFRHYYDGGGYTISNLCLDGNATGLISVAQNAIFRNINLKHVTDRAAGNGSAEAKRDVGALVGCAIGSSFYDCSVSIDFRRGGYGAGGLAGRVVIVDGQTDLMHRCHATGYMESQYESIGGLIGCIESNFWNDADSDSMALVENCSAAVEMQAGAGGVVGGLIGEANNIRLLHCFATGNVTAATEGIGGLVGQARYNTEIAYCYATGNVICTSKNQYGGSFAGGLVGFMLSYTQMHDCYATGDVTAETLGWSDCQDQSSYDGGPWLRYRNPCGSLVGCVQMMGSYGKTVLYNCYATGFVTAPQICKDERIYCNGALVGCFYDNYTRKYIIDTKKTDQTDWAGFNDTSVEKLTGNYNLQELRTYYTPANYFERYTLQPRYVMPTYEYVQIITQTQLRDQSVFQGWDFENVWIMTENGPQLR